jgi:hypothetical protein
MNNEMKKIKPARAVSIIKREIDSKHKEILKLRKTIDTIQEKIDSGAYIGNMYAVDKEKNMISYAKSKEREIRSELNALRREAYGPWAPRSIDCTDGEASTK